MDNIIQVENLTKKFYLESGFFARKDNFVYAVNDVSFSVERGKTYGIVGESGCGKTTVAKLLAGMYKSDSGKIIFNPQKNSSGMQNKSLIKYIFQDPARSLNPRMTVFTILTEGLRHSSLWPGKTQARKIAGDILEETGLSRQDLDKFPGEFSGGQRQRISIARGLLCQPELLICDEVVSALDVSIQGQILNLLQEIRQKRNLSMIFIAHDLRVSCYFCDRIGVMYQGIMVEEGKAANFYRECVHPYTKILFQGCMGTLSSKDSEVRTALKPPEGCPFCYRCPKAKNCCLTERPEWKEIKPGHYVRCFYPETVSENNL